MHTGSEVDFVEGGWRERETSLALTDSFNRRYLYQCMVYRETRQEANRTHSPRVSEWSNTVVEAGESPDWLSECLDFSSLTPKPDPEHQ